jgi:hypothetical protein
VGYKGFLIRYFNGHTKYTSPVKAVPRLFLKNIELQSSHYRKIWTICWELVADPLRSAEHTLGTTAVCDSNTMTSKLGYVTWREFNQSAIVFDTHAVFLLSHFRVTVKIACFGSFSFFVLFFFARIYNEVVETLMLALPCLPPCLTVGRIFFAFVIEKFSGVFWHIRI